MEIADDSNLLSKYRYQVLCRHRRQSPSEKFRQNESPKSNVEISQAQGQRITIGKGYCEGRQEEDGEFTLIEEDGLEGDVPEVRHEVSCRIH